MYIYNIYNINMYYKLVNDMICIYIYIYIICVYIYIYIYICIYTLSMFIVVISN